MQTKAIFTTFLLLSIVSTHGLSADGVLEINQTCALNGGCFSGDSAGYPVTVDGSAGRSYKLTGDLDLTSQPTAVAIVISASFVTLDLNGFQIAGPTECVIEPVIGSELICTPSNNGAHGIELAGALESVTIKNGAIRGMPDDGVSGADAELTRLEGVIFSENAGWGALLGDRALIQSSRARWNGGGGFSVKDNSNISHSQAFGNDGNGFDAGDSAVVSFSNGEAGFSDHRAFELGPRSKFKDSTVQGTARCGGGLCTSDRRFFLTTEGYLPTQAVGACGSGFHLASIFELTISNQLRYDYVQGVSNVSSGFGPPVMSPELTVDGWVRSGDPFTDCLAFSSDDEGERGTAARLPRNLVGAGEGTLMDPAVRISPWISNGARSCDFPRRVWCIEN